MWNFLSEEFTLHSKYASKTPAERSLIKSSLSRSSFSRQTSQREEMRHDTFNFNATTYSMNPFIVVSETGIN